MSSRIGISRSFKMPEDLANLGSPFAWACQSGSGLQPPLDETCALQVTRVLTAPVVSQRGAERPLPVITKSVLLFLQSESYGESKIFWVPTFSTKVPRGALSCCMGSLEQKFISRAVFGPHSVLCHNYRHHSCHHATFIGPLAGCVHNETGHSSP